MLAFHNTILSLPSYFNNYQDTTPCTYSSRQGMRTRDTGWRTRDTGRVSPTPGEVGGWHTQLAHPCRRICFSSTVPVPTRKITPPGTGATPLLGCPSTQRAAPGSPVFPEWLKKHQTQPLAAPPRAPRTTHTLFRGALLSPSTWTRFLPSTRGCRRCAAHHPCMPCCQAPAPSLFLQKTPTCEQAASTLRGGSAG